MQPRLNAVFPWRHHCKSDRIPMNAVRRMLRPLRHQENGENHHDCNNENSSNSWVSRIRSLCCLPALHWGLNLPQQRTFPVLPSASQVSKQHCGSDIRLLWPWKNPSFFLILYFPRNTIGCSWTKKKILEKQIVTQVPRSVYWISLPLLILKRAVVCAFINFM